MPGIWFWFLLHSENFQRTAIPYPDATDVYFSARIGDSRAFFNCIFRVICVDDNYIFCFLSFKIRLIFYIQNMK